MQRFTKSIIFALEKIKIMDKLKIYSAYLPFEVKVSYNSIDYIGVLKSIDTFRNQVSFFSKHLFEQIEIEDVKPILFSLEDLTKEITIGGETFVPIVELANEFTDDSFNDYYLDKFFKTEIVLREKYSRYYFKIQFKNDKIVGFDNNDTELPQFDIFQKLLEWKFNVFNLPEIEYIKVTEENNPYK